MSKWMVRAKRADFKALGEKYNIDQVVARILINRDIPEEAFARFLHPDIRDMHDAALLADGGRAAELLAEAIKKGAHIRVIGDYDIDGICSTYILISAIRRCGGHADYAIPHRTTDGYGLNMRLVEEAHTDGVELIITCDNGISAYDEIAEAKRLGMGVIVTDHHSIYRLPPADAVVNPHRDDDAYPFGDICGAVVAWRVVQLLYRLFDIADSEAMSFVELAAFATVGDIMPLIDENRAIVREGLIRLSHTDNIGLNALIDKSGIDRDHLSAYHIGFVLGPCFNASGRLDTATLAVELLLEKDPIRAAERAAELVTLNAERKQMTETGTRDALAAIEADGLSDDPVIVVYVPTLHESLCGIVAGRLKERYHRPVFVLCDGEQCVKGSGRSIEAYPMFERMSDCAELFIKYGGHPMAAGLSIQRESVDELRSRLIAGCGLGVEELEPKVMIDVPMPIDYINIPLIRQIEALEPFGTANEKPLFADKGLSVQSVRAIGSEKQYRKLVLKSAHGATIDALYFGNEAEGLDCARALSVVYEAQINSYRGSETPQIVIREYQAAD